MASPIDSEWEDVTPTNDSEWEDVSEPMQAGFGLGDAWKALAVPEKLSREGLGMISNAIPETIGGPMSGNRFSDVVRGTPRVLAETVSEVAPSFVSRGALTLGAAGKGLQTAAKIPLFQKGASAIGRGVAKTLEKTVGINADNTRRLFNKPAELFSAPTKKDVSVAYSKSELPGTTKTLDDIVSEGTASYVGKVKMAGKKLLSGSDDAKSILEGRKALDKQIAALDVQIDSAKGSAKSALLSAKQAKLDLRNEFNKALDVIAPKLRQADAVASRQLAVDPFRRVFLPGKMHFFSPEGIARVVPGLPTAVGLGVSGAGGAARLFGKAIGAGGKIGETAGGIFENMRRPTPKRLFRKAI